MNGKKCDWLFVLRLYPCSKLSIVTLSLLTWVRQSCGFVAVSEKRDKFHLWVKPLKMHIIFNNFMYYYKYAILQPEDQPHFRLRFLGLLRRSKNQNISEWCSTPGLVHALTYCYILLQWSQCAVDIHVYMYMYMYSTPIGQTYPKSAMSFKNQGLKIWTVPLIASIWKNRIPYS